MFILKELMTDWINNPPNQKVKVDRDFSVRDKLKKLRGTGKKHNNYIYVITFFKKLVPAISSISNLKQFFKHIIHNKISGTVTVHEEALALWFLYNNEDKWRNHFLKKHDEETYGSLEVPYPVYTGSLSGHHPYQGWNNDGMIKYSSLLEDVKKDRADETNNFELMFQQEISQETNKGKKNDKDENRPSVRIENDLEVDSYDTFWGEDGNKSTTGVTGKTTMIHILIMMRIKYY